VNGLALQPAHFQTKRFCPFHGGFILLADCPIVGTNEALVTAGPIAAMGTSGQETLTSAFDGKERVVLSRPPAAPQLPQRRFGGTKVADLPSPVELVGDSAAAGTRPVRACSVCRHPLPAGIDTRDPMSVSLVGHSGASKTTTLVALAEQVRQHGPALIGFDEFMPTEATARRFRAVMGDYRHAGGSVRVTATNELHPPLEFLAAPGRANQPINVLFHDVAGEQLMDTDERLKTAPAVLWSDLVIYFYNPEESPRLQLVRAGQDQAVMLNAVHDDIVEMTRYRNAWDGSPFLPPLIVLLCKADLLPAEVARVADQGETGVQAAIRALGDADVVDAGLRWPEVYWRLISAQPAGGHPPRGLVDVFDMVSRLLRERT